MSTSNSAALPSEQQPNDHQKNAATFLREQILAFRNTQLIAVAAKLNIAEFLRNGPLTARQLSELAECNEDALYRLLRALSSLGIFQEKEKGIFANTLVSELVSENTTGSLRSIALLYGEPWLWHAYGELHYSVKYGRQAFEYVHGKTLYDFLQEDREAASTFNSAMSAFSGTEASAVVKAYNFSLKQMVVDVGGGEGFLVNALINAYPNLRGIVLDLPITGQPENSTRSDGAVSYVYGNFFNKIPAGGDVYLLKSILHNWDDDSCIAILKNCRKVMSDKSSLLVIERLIPVGGGKSDAKLFDINMMIMTEGRERNEGEYRKIFREAGFLLTRIISTPSPLSIIEGSPISSF